MYCYANTTLNREEYNTYLSNSELKHKDIFICEYCKDLFEVRLIFPDFLISMSIDEKNNYINHISGIKIYKLDEILLIDFGSAKAALEHAQNIIDNMKPESEGKYMVISENLKEEDVWNKIESLGL